MKDQLYKWSENPGDTMEAMQIWNRLVITELESLTRKFSEMKQEYAII